MKALATDTFDEPVADAEPDADPEHSAESPFEYTLRATEGSKIESHTQTLEGDEFVKALDLLTERVGFEPTVTQKCHTGFRDRHLLMSRVP